MRCAPPGEARPGHTCGEGKVGVTPTGGFSGPLRVHVFYNGLLKVTSHAGGIDGSRCHRPVEQAGARVERVM
jgi:hypothetical protein